MSVVVKKILEKLAKKAKPRGKPKGILKQKIEYVKSIPGKNTKKRTYIVSPHAGKNASSFTCDWWFN
jgi:hypothetical protein